MTIHVLTAEYGPDSGGVGAYTDLLVEALRRRHLRVRVWTIGDLQLKTSLPAALKVEPGFVLLQYVPNALGARGANVAFCRWLLSLRRKGADVRVMFHEPYFYFSWNPALNALATAQRLMAAILLRASARTYVSTERWRDYLAPYAPAGTQFTVLPIPSTLPDAASPHQTAALRRHLAAHDEVLAGRVHATGALDRAEAACAIAACDVALQPYPDGVTTRRTSVMAPVALGVPTVTSHGALTEPVWSEGRPVILAPASDSRAHVTAAASLLNDEAMRRQVGAQGRQLYEERFSIERTASVLAADAVRVP